MKQIVTLAVSAAVLAAAPAGCGTTTKDKNVEAIEKALARGRDVNDYDANGLTMLHVYAARGSAAGVKYLLKNGAKANMPVRRPPNFGYTAMHFAAAKGHVKVAELLIKDGANVNVAAVGDKDVGNFDGRTPLHLAAANGHKDMVELLLQEGAMPEMNDTAGKRAGDLAEANGHKDIAALLSAPKK